MTAAVDWQAVAREELRFFGNATAAISHEINNRFAVINEKAGLLQDLAAMLAAGREVDPARFATQSAKITDQVRLAKQVVGQLNRFAHSVDTAHATVDVADLLEFVAALYARKAAVAEVELEISAPPRPINVDADPFALATMVGRGLDIALARTGAAKSIRITATTTDDGFQVRFEGLADGGEKPEVPDPEQAIPALLEWSGAGYRLEGGTVLRLDIPDRNPHATGGQHE
jgi:C4-dicarboxylate-specific signal transduction histidine kinase